MVEQNKSYFIAIYWEKTWKYSNKDDYLFKKQLLWTSKNNSGKTLTEVSMKLKNLIVEL